MIFRLLHAYARLVLPLYCRKISINKPENLKMQGPLLIAANHPNSFLDGMILTALFENPVYSLARGDAFKKRGFNKILRWLRLLPVYRTSEGSRNLHHNYTTFAACRKTFEKKGIVLIFSEAACTNEWKLRSLKKGTARLSITSWQEGMDLEVLPLGINYSSFRSFGKNVVLNFGSAIKKEPVLNESSEGKQLLEFNDQLEDQLQQLVYSIDPADIKSLEEKLGVFVPGWQKMILLLPALAGWLVHAPLYYTVKIFCFLFFNNDHYDSVMAALLFLLYPLYLLIIVLVVLQWIDPFPVFLLLLFMPFGARAYLLIKNQFPQRQKKGEPYGSPI